MKVLLVYALITAIIVLLAGKRRIHTYQVYNLKYQDTEIYINFQLMPYQVGDTIRITTGRDPAYQKAIIIKKK